MLANVTWPSLLLYERTRAWWVIVAVVAVEFMILRRSLRGTPAWAFAVVLLINLFSAVVGIIPLVPWNNAIPFDHPAGIPALAWFGLVWGLHVDSSFSAISWIAAILFSALLNTLLEGMLLFTAFRRTATQRCLLLLPAANFASALLTYFSLAVW